MGACRPRVEPVRAARSHSGVTAPSEGPGWADAAGDGSALTWPCRRARTQWWQDTNRAVAFGPSEEAGGIPQAGLAGAVRERLGPVGSVKGGKASRGQAGGPPVTGTQRPEQPQPGLVSRRWSRWLASSQKLAGDGPSAGIRFQ